MEPQPLVLDRGKASFFVARTEDPRYQFTAIKASFLLHAPTAPISPPSPPSPSPSSSPHAAADVATPSSSIVAEGARPMQMGGGHHVATSHRGRSILILPVPNEPPLPPCCQKEALAASTSAAAATQSPRAHPPEPAAAAAATSAPSAHGSRSGGGSGNGSAGVQLLDLYAAYPNLFTVCKQMFRLGEGAALDREESSGCGTTPPPPPPLEQSKRTGDGEAATTTAATLGGEDDEDEVNVEAEARQGRAVEVHHARSGGAGGKGGSIILVTHRANNVLPTRSSGSSRRQSLHSSSLVSPRRRSVQRQRRLLAGGSVIVANSFRELEDMVEIAGAPATSSSLSSSAQAVGHTSVEDELTAHGTDAESDEQGSSGSERRSTEGEMTAEDGPFPRRHIEVTAEEMAALKARYEKGHAFVVCVLTRTRSGRREASDSESESDISSEGEEEARERQKRLAEKAQLVGLVPAISDLDSVRLKDSAALEAMDKDENVNESENESEDEGAEVIPHLQAQDMDNTAGIVEDEEMGVGEGEQGQEESVSNEQGDEGEDGDEATREVGQRLADDATALEEGDQLEQQLDRKIRERIESDKLGWSGSQSSLPSSSYSLTHSSSSLYASHSSLAMTLEGGAEDSEVAGSAYVSPLLSPTLELSLSPSPDPEQDQLNQQILAALAPKEDELDEDEIRLLDMRRTHSNDVEDDHGFSLTSPQPKAFAQNLEKIYSSLEQVDSSVLFPEQQRLAMEEYENRIKQGVERRAKEREDRLNEIMSGYKKVLGMEEPAAQKSDDEQGQATDAHVREELPPGAEDEDEDEAGEEKEVMDDDEAFLLNQDDEEIPEDAEAMARIEEQKKAKGSAGEEQETKGKELWFEDIDNGRKAQELIDKRRSERRKRRKSKLRKRKGNSSHIKDHLLDSNGADANKVVVFLAFKHPTTRDGRLFIPLTCLDHPTTEYDETSKMAMTLRTQGRRNGEPAECEERGTVKRVTIYSVNTEEEAGVSLDQVYASYYARMQTGRKKAEKDAHEKNRNLSETEELAWHHLASLLVLYERKVISKKEYELRRSLIAGSFSSTRLASPGPLPASTLSSPLLVPLRHNDDDDDDNSQEEDKPTHGFPPTFWSQLRLEKLEEARFPVKLAPVYELRKSLINTPKPQTDIYWLISEASDALYRLLKENSKRMKPLRDSTAGRTAVEKQEETYRRILKAHPLHPFALYSYARFLSNVRKDDRQADQYFQLALKASPFNPEMLSTYAHFLERRLRDLDKAHRYYKRAYFVDRLNADVVGAYAIFQHRMLRNYKEAEKLFKQALELDDENVNLVGYYALFLQKAKRNLSESENYYRRALDLARGRKNLHDFWKLKLKELRVEMKEAKERQRSSRSRSLSWQKSADSPDEESSPDEDGERPSGRRGRSRSGRDSSAATASEKDQLISLQEKTAMEQFLAELFVQDEREERERLEGKPVRPIREDKARLSSAHRSLAGVALTETLLRRDMGRAVFCRVLNQQRAKRMRLGEATFGTLCKLVRTSLDECDAAKDFVSARALMHMASTFYFAPAPTSSASPLASSQSWSSGARKDMVYLRQRLEDASIWRNASFWKYMFTELVCKEKAKVQKVLTPVAPSPSLLSPRRLLGKRPASSAPPPSLPDDSREVIGLLASFAYAMLGAGAEIKEVLEFVEQMCRLNHLPLHRESLSAILGLK